MGHRALVAYERATGRYDVHYSHWGGDLDLRRRIDEGSPYGGPLSESDDGPAVDPEPIGVDLAFRDVVTEYVDFLQHEALYVVAPDFEVAEYRVLPFVVPTADGLVEGDAAVGRGALLEVSPFDPGRGYVRGWFDGVRDVVGELVDRRVLAEADVVPYLEDRLRRFAGLDRGVIVDPGRDD